MWFLAPDEKKKTIISGLIVGGLVLALGMGVFYTQNTSNPQVYRTQAAPAAAIESFLPKPGSKLSKTIEIQAKAQTKDDLKNLFAVVKIGSYQSEPLTLERLDPNSILIQGMLNTQKYPNNSYPLTIYLYNNASGKTKLIGSVQYSVVIAN